MPNTSTHPWVRLSPTLAFADIRPQDLQPGDFVAVSNSRPVAESLAEFRGFVRREAEEEPEAGQLRHPMPSGFATIQTSKDDLIVNLHGRITVWSVN